ncbi:phage tail tube protein [Clostridium sp. HMP27]|uniref:phage tail tube protein n=1 Tax=Clostridium sp. HMP27 TaxID=1487921 RepID=UPI00052B9D5F|nr:phage tail tube protein [Clostridium sp. HMP27]KGK88041.1 hypothetical protein DP68_08925 [Clostridium sp. HMP27]
MWESKNAISAKEGRFFLEGEEVLNGIKLEVEVEKEKVEIKRLGKRMTGHKSVGLSGSGTITEYRATSKWIKVLQRFKDTGEDVYLTCVAITNDTASGRGAEPITLYGVNIDSLTLINMDAEGDVIKDEIPFTIEDFNLQGDGLKDTL